MNENQKKNTEQFRSGWDRIFNKKPAQPKEEKK